MKYESGMILPNYPFEFKSAEIFMLSESTFENDLDALSVSALQNDYSSQFDCIDLFKLFRDSFVG